MIYLLPKNNDKPVKIIFEELPCPILLNLGISHRCKHVKTKSEEMNWILYCSEYEQNNKCVMDKF